MEERKDHQTNVKSSLQRAGGLVPPPEPIKTDAKEIVKPFVQAQPKRTYSENMVIDSDLFELELAGMLKNVALPGLKAEPILRKISHLHFYRTVDSNGRKPKKCSSIGGHYHTIEVSVDSNGRLQGKCSKAIGTDPRLGDDHTHTVSYIRTDRVSKRKMNEDAQKSIANRETPVYGT